MDRQQQINRFTLAAHRVLIERLRADPGLMNEARSVIARWRQVADGPSHCEPYWAEWDHLLAGSPLDIETAVCIDTDRAATLRSVSPLGRFLSTHERQALLRESRTAA